MDLAPHLDKKFGGLWSRAGTLPSLSDLNTETLAGWAKEAGLTVVDVVERNVGMFQAVPAIVLTVEGGTAYFPKISATKCPTWLANKTACERIAAAWEKVEWFEPLWVRQGDRNKLLADIEHRSKKDAIASFDYHTSTIYTLAFQAVCIAQLIPKSRSLAPFAPIAREAYLAFYAGHRASSIAALIPVMEGALQRISEENSTLHVPAQIDRIIDRACALAGRVHYDGNWVPSDYQTKEYLYAQDERVFIFETYRQWLKGTFFRQTGEYDGITWLNRHLFAHGASTQWTNSGNFCRLVVALATLGVIESWHDETNSVPMLLPKMNDDSTLLWQQAQNQAKGQMMLKLLERKNYHKHGQIVPPMPTDDGVTLRKAHLAQQCVNDLVRPLRNAGWSVEVAEPDARALYMTVEAKCADETLRVALLYSCATDNKLYRELAQSASAILYLGAPYNQSAYAYGINVHVGPVTAWQPPRAPAGQVKRPLAGLKDRFPSLLAWTRSVITGLRRVSR
ncbi:hypothetical protein [Burkholderia ambifaria]|uniref:hypothetical protein n=1 Tax=Burkholderia ambifaria TaxID=152480 RepID=UPI001C935EB7|nr:hypothetical protein [Burkholderia ambifaria]MBY4769286.1 hypothetical protein [Burkholderia ambifaria]